MRLAGGQAAKDRRKVREHCERCDGFCRAVADLGAPLHFHHIKPDAAEVAIWNAWHQSSRRRLVADRKSTRLNSSHVSESRMPSSA